MLLVYPPVSRSPEPPIGLARLSGWLRSGGVEARCIDLNQEGLDYLLALSGSEEVGAPRSTDARGLRMATALRESRTYENFDRYSRAVGEVSKTMRELSSRAGAIVSLGDYRDPSLSPLRKSDLIRSAEGFEGNVFFPLFEKRLPPEIRRCASSGSETTIGISVCYLSQALSAFALCGYVRRAFSSSRIILGGGLITSWLACGQLEEDETFDGLVDALLPGPGEASLAAYLGLCEVRLDAAPVFEDFRELPYFAPSKILPYNFAYGCPWKRCSFCPEAAEGMPYISKDRGAAAREIRELAESESPALFHFTDNEVAPAYLRDLASSPPGAPWYGFARFSDFLLDSSACERLAASGCVMLQLGLESADQGVLEALGKGTRIEEIDRILKNLEAASIAVYLYVLFGTPAEDRDSALRTRDFIASRAQRIGFLNLALFNLPASGKEAGELETTDFYDGDLSLYSEFRHPKGWGRAEARAFLEKDFLSVPELRAIARRTPPVFTSNHAPFFLPRMGCGGDQRG
jgi:hypothetical protein